MADTTLPRNRDAETEPRRCIGCAAELAATDVRCPFCGTDQRPAPDWAPVVVERSRGTKIRELVAVLLMFSVMVYVVRRSFENGDLPTPVPTAVVTPTPSPSPPAVAGSLKLGSAPPEITADRSATFSYAWSGTQGGTFECRLDDQPFSACDPSGRLVVDLADGIHTFQVRVVRADGSFTDAVSHSWTVDATPPSLAIRPESGEFVSPPRVTLDASEPTDIFYTLDGTEPTADSQAYRAPVDISQPATLKAIAVDKAGNRSPLASATYGFTSSFRDGFESGSLDRWTTIDGMQVEATIARTGRTAARAASSDGTRAYAGLDLAAPATELFVQTAFRIERQGENPVALTRLRTDGNASIVSLYVTSSGRLAIQLAGTTSVTSGRVVSPGAWHEVQMHTVVAGAQSRVEVWFDGEHVDRLDVVADLSTAPIRTVQLGESAEGRVFDVLFDDVATDDTFIPSSFLILTGGPSTPEVAVDVASPVATPVATLSP